MQALLLVSVANGSSMQGQPGPGIGWVAAGACGQTGLST